MGQTRTSYETRIRGHLGDFGVLQRVPAERIPLALETALAVLSNDRPREATATLTGDGSTYNLTLTQWVDRWSRVLRVEYPTGEREPSYMEARRWMVLPGTTTFRLLADTPAVGESCTVTYSVRWPYPDDTTTTDQVPAPWFEAVCALAAAEATKAQAVEYARRQSTFVQGDLHTLDAEPLFTAAAQLRRLYEQIVLGAAGEARAGAGAPAGPVGLAVEDQETFSRSLFHRRSTYTP